MNFSYTPGFKFNQLQYDDWMEALKNHKQVFHQCLIQAVEVASPMEMSTKEEIAAKRAVEQTISVLSSYLGYWNPVAMRKSYEEEVVLGGIINKTYGPNSLCWSFAFKYLFWFPLSTKLDSEFIHRPSRFYFERKLDKKIEKACLCPDGMTTTSGLRKKVEEHLNRIKKTREQHGDIW